MNPAVNSIANRLSLRPPQWASLEILARISDIISLKKGADFSQAAAGSVRNVTPHYLRSPWIPSVPDWEHTPRTAPC